MTNVTEVANRFVYHTAQTAARVYAHNQVRERFRRLAVSLAGSLPEGREKALALTKLEEAMFWANSGIARAPEGAEQYGPIETIPMQRVVEAPTSETLDMMGRSAYRAYGRVTDFKNFRGEPMPAWENLTPEIQSAWVASANHIREGVLSALDKENNA